MPHERHSRHTTVKGVAYSIQDMIRDIRALNSSVLLLTQKMNYVVRNEKILGRNLIILNKKLKALESRASSTGVSSAEGTEFPSVQELKDSLYALEEKINQNSAMINDINTSLEKMKESFAKAEELKELKYVIDAINPLEFVTLEQAKELMQGKKTVKPKKKKK